MYTFWVEVAEWHFRYNFENFWFICDRLPNNTHQEFCQIIYSDAYGGQSLRNLV